jgi:hypothetical protein
LVDEKLESSGFACSDCEEAQFLQNKVLPKNKLLLKAVPKPAPEYGFGGHFF